ncbi:MAG: hypothetical protein KDI61_03320 [Alphaproteobacteria bacterium]|nr:hypothetical protein [Alphaproteobacteria bacterium]
MKELSKWNDGKGIDLEGWISCEGNFSLAVGYSEIFWPEFVEFEDYILRKGFSESSLRSFENQDQSDKKGTEWLMNHLHIADIQHSYCEDLTRDKILFLAPILVEIYQAKLAWQFPDKPCTVEFYHPDDKDDLIGYQMSFWQKKHEK